MFKLYARAFKRSPHLAAISAMAFFTVSLASFLAYQSYTEANRFGASTFSKWSDFQKSHSSRSIASSEEFICQHDGVNPAELDREISRLESQYETGHFIEGNWYGVNLKAMPSIQAQLLANYGELIGDRSKAQDFKGCRDVPCVVNKVYQDLSGISGKIVYYWYLKTGSMINLSNRVPNQNSGLAGVYQGNSHPFESYLFSKEELKDLYTLAKSLPEKFAHNPLFKSLHKVPDAAVIEERKNCAASLPSGQVMISESCLGGGKSAFMSSIANQIAKYVDQYHSKTNGAIPFSQTDEWLASSLWSKEEAWDMPTREYRYVWKAKSKENAIESASSPGEQLSRLLSQYRFRPEQFKSNTSSDVQELVKNEFFTGKSYDANGLFVSFLNKSVSEWSRREASLWKDCVDKHFDPEKFEKGQRDLASSVENPLYSCVEKKIPEFEREMVETIQKENAQGCAFFNDSQKYGHVSKRYSEAMDKFLLEKILQRKIELRRHGVEVLAGQALKQEFLEKVDPTSVYINCHSPRQTEGCYEKTIEAKLDKELARHKNISEYYGKVIKEDVLQLFSFDQIQLKTREIAKKFIAPFYSQVHFASKHIWETCKAAGRDEEEIINLPLQFTGGRHYVNAELLNCVNQAMDDKLYEIVNLGAFQKEGDKLVEFNLNEREQKFALTFMRGKMRQVMNNILEEEVRLEAGRLASYFDDRQPKILKTFAESEELLEEVYSLQQIQGKCLEKVTEHYPKNFYYSPKSKVDASYGRKICSAFIQKPENSQKIRAKIAEQWERNKNLALGLLDESFDDLTEDCRDDYGNPRMLQICIEESYKTAMRESIEEWRDEDDYKHFSDKEQELVQHMASISSAKIQAAINRE